MKEIIEINTKNYQPNIVLHACCAPCAIYPFKMLKENEKPLFYFFNPNIEPYEEYCKREEEIIKYSKKSMMVLVVERGFKEDWHNQTTPHAESKEGETRCVICYRFRLLKTALLAKERGIKYFTTVMSISPHKNSDKLNEVGFEVEKETGVLYKSVNFKKNDGFNKSVKYSREEGFYRQTYCGCLFALRLMKK